MVAAMVRRLLRLALVPIDAAGPSRSRLAIRRLDLRLRRPLEHEPPHASID